MRQHCSGRDATATWLKAAAKHNTTKKDSSTNQCGNTLKRKGGVYLLGMLCVQLLKALLLLQLLGLQDLLLALEQLLLGTAIHQLRQPLLL